MQEDYKPYLGDKTYVSVGGDIYPRQVVCAANKWDDVVVLGIRHFCPMMSGICNKLGINQRSPHEQGFVDQWGNFMSREEAALIIRTHGRFLRDDEFGDKLYSENLY